MSLFAGAPAPMFIAPSKINPNFAFGSVAGRYVLLCFLPAPGPEREGIERLIHERLGGIDDHERLFFGVLPDAESFAAKSDAPPFRWFLDRQGDVRRAYDAEDADGRPVALWVLLDPSMRLLGWAGGERSDHVITTFLGLGSPLEHAGVPLHAPVMIVPRIFEPELCRKLIDVYEAIGGAPSGVMRYRDGRTVGELDDFKRRRDAQIDDPDLCNEIRARLSRRLLPQIVKAFGFTATRVERYIVACYRADEGGYFRAHRDNGTPGTAHRKFAVSINLNAEEFEGGDLCFPEYGLRTYRPPTGGAVVFGCGLLHEATPVTRGVRYAYLPFLYDEEGARLRDANAHTFAPADPQAADASTQEDRKLQVYDHR